MSFEPRRVRVPRVDVLAARDFPRPGVTTVATLGLSAMPHTLYRGKDVCRELVSTMRTTLVPRLAEFVAAAAHAHLTAKDRKPPVEVNGVWAPGFPPHLLFAPALASIPDLDGRHLVGGKYVEFLPAVPITEAELRRYDRDAPALIRALKTSRNLADHEAR